jgi:hypothetical protein
MRNPAHQTRENRTITVDFQNEATYFQRLCRNFHLRPFEV